MIPREPPFSPAFRELYRLERLLGEGGMGAVWLAEDLKLARPVAIKVLKAGGPGEQARFVREGRIMAALAHPRIVRVFDAGQDGACPYLVCELVDGTTLDARLGAGPIALAQALRIAEALAEALEYAHEQGVVHRDVKPPNVFLTREGEAKLADFGLARGAEGGTLTAEGTLMGTPEYMSPDQLTASRVGPESDQYALGLVLYRMVTGALPFFGPTPLELAMCRLRQPPTPPRALAPSVPEDVERVVLRMLARDPAERFPSTTRARQAIQALQRATQVAEHEVAAASDGPTPTLADPGAAGASGPAARRRPGSQSVTRKARPAVTMVSVAPEAPEAPASRGSRGGVRLALAAGLLLAGVALATGVRSLRPAPGPAVTESASVSSIAPPPASLAEDLALVSDWHRKLYPLGAAVPPERASAGHAWIWYLERLHAALNGTAPADRLVQALEERGAMSDRRARFVALAERAERACRPLEPAARALLAAPAPAVSSGSQRMAYEVLTPLLILDRLLPAYDAPAQLHAAGWLGRRYAPGPASGARGEDGIARLDIQPPTYLIARSMNRAMAEGADLLMSAQMRTGAQQVMEVPATLTLPEPAVAWRTCERLSIGIASWKAQQDRVAITPADLLWVTLEVAPPFRLLLHGDCALPAENSENRLYVHAFDPALLAGATSVNLRIEREVMRARWETAPGQTESPNPVVFVGNVRLEVPH